jgi:hypothetical protein
LERKKEVLDLYHAAVHAAGGQTEKEAEKPKPPKAKGHETEL